MVESGIYHLIPSKVSCMRISLCFTLDVTINKNTTFKCILQSLLYTHEKVTDS